MLYNFRSYLLDMKVWEQYAFCRSLLQAWRLGLSVEENLDFINEVLEALNSGD